MEGGKESLNSPNTGKTLKKHAREVDTLKKIIGEYAVANEALKKRWEEAEDEGSSRGKKKHQLGKVAPVLRHLQDRVVLHKKAQERGDGSPDGDEDHGDCREEAHIRHAPDGRSACQAVWTARKPEEGGQNIPKTGLEHAWKTQIGNNPLKQEGSQTDCAKPVLGGRHVLHMVRKGHLGCGAAGLAGL